MELKVDSYREIPLSRGQVAIVSAEDYDEVASLPWYALWYPHTKSYYAVRGEGSKGNRKLISMHRQLLRLESGDKRIGDHANGDTLDNRRGNLRIATHQQNNQNCRLSSRNTSGLKGAFWHKRLKRWQAAIRVDGRLVYLGYHQSAQDAHNAYRVAAEKYHGEFARLS